MKKKTITLLLTVACLLIFAGCGNQKAASDDFVLKIGYGGSLCEAPVHIALEKGYFEQEGLNVDLIKLAPGAQFEAVTAGQIDASFGLLASLIQPLSNGLPIKITSGLHTGCDKLLVPNDSTIKSAEDFKGKRIGVPSMNSSPIIFTKRFLSEKGVNVTEKNPEVEFVVFSAGELPLALQRGAIDAIAMNDPAASVAIRENGLVAVADSAVTPPYNEQYCCAAYVSDSIAKNSPEIAAKYTRALQKASQWIAENQDEAAQIQVDKKWVPGDPVFNASILKTYNYIPSAKGAYDAFSITAKQMQQVGMLDAGVDVDALQGESFLLFDANNGII
jgi:NitT/TauT family transport system substrate-binding protein